MKRIATTIVCLMLVAGCATAGQPEKQAAAKQTPQERIAELDKLIKVTGAKVNDLPLWKERVKRVTEVIKADPEIKKIDEKIMSTPEWKQLKALQTEREYLQRYK